MNYTYLKTYFINPQLSNELLPTFYEYIEQFLGSGGGVNNKAYHANGGGAIILRSQTYNLLGAINTNGYPLDATYFKTKTVAGGSGGYILIDQVSNTTVDSTKLVISSILNV